MLDIYNFFLYIIGYQGSPQRSFFSTRIKKLKTRSDSLDYFFGAVAHLGERLVCTEKVAGSIPVSSTYYVV